MTQTNRPDFLADTETCFVLRTCTEELKSYFNGLQWPGEGGVAEAPDWEPVAQCGAGLHGLLRGEGEAEHLAWTDAKAKWLVVEVAKREMLDLGGKVKFRRGLVVHVGDRMSATATMRKLYPDARVHGSTETAGDEGTATAGVRGTATAGDDGVLILMHWTGARCVRRVALVGQDGIKPNTKYKLDVDGKFVEVV